MKYNYTVAGISAGLGVSLYPFKENLIFNIEGRGIFHTPGNEQWKSNFGDIPLFKQFNLDLLKNPSSKNGIKKPNVIISSPDCGSGSIFRLSRAKKLGNHKNNVSLGYFFAAIQFYNPDFFYFENLEGLYKSFPKERFVGLTTNYRLIEFKAPVSKWGNSQIHRKRLIIIGIRRDLPKNLKKCFRLPKQVKLKVCQELYGDLMGKGKNRRLSGNVREDITTVISIHAKRKLSLHDIQKHWWDQPHAKRWNSPGYAFSTAPGVYRNLAEDYPATARKANRQYDHNGLTLTPRQLARIQGVPDKFNIWINPDKINYCINKARTAVTKTPPYEISVWFKKCLKKAYKKLS